MVQKYLKTVENGWQQLKTVEQNADLEKTIFMNSDFNFFNDFPPSLSNFLPNLDPWTCKLEITSKISSSKPVNDAKYVNTM